MSDIQHGKRITTETFYDGDTTNIKQEVEVSLFTDKGKLLKDIIDCLTVITNGTSNKLTIEVCIDKQQRYRIIKKWVINDIT